MLLVDPVLPAPGADRERFRRAINRDLARLGGPVHVMLTRAAQPRDAGALARMTGGDIWTMGDPLPPGMQAVPTGREGEVALWSDPHAALMPGGALVVHGGEVVAAPGADGPALLALAPAVIIPSVGPMVTGG